MKIYLYSEWKLWKIWEVKIREIILWKSAEQSGGLEGLQLEHDLVPPVPELHGAVVAGGVVHVLIHAVHTVS